MKNKASYVKVFSIKSNKNAYGRPISYAKAVKHNGYWWIPSKTRSNIGDTVGVKLEFDRYGSSTGNLIVHAIGTQFSDEKWKALEYDDEFDIVTKGKKTMKKVAVKKTSVKKKVVTPKIPEALKTLSNSLKELDAEKVNIEDQYDAIEDLNDLIRDFAYLVERYQGGLYIDAKKIMKSIAEVSKTFVHTY